MADFPPEVSDRLASLDTIAVDVGIPGDAFRVSGIVAPLRGQTFLLLPASPALEEALKTSGEGVLIAEPADRNWSVQSRGTMVLGRRASADVRRGELAHWIPDNQSATAYLAVPFFPETLDYQYDAKDGRRRANGPIPGGARASWGKAVATVGGDALWVWFFFAGILQAFTLLFFGDPLHRNVFALTLLLACGMLPLIGAKLAFAPLDMDRWRSGRETDKAVEHIARGGLSEAGYSRAGTQILLASAALWVLLVVALGSVAAATCALVSGAPMILLVMAVRRRSTKTVEEEA